MAIHEQVRVQAAEGPCDAHVLRPAKGQWPAVLMYMDGIGIRDALVQMAERIAGAGYFVLLPNLFYRIGGPSADVKVFFSDPAARKVWMDRVRPAAGIDKIMADTGAFLKYLESRPEARPGRIGVTGYCMGGRMALAAAGTFGDRVACAAAFHPGGLATEAPDSPHLLANRIRGELYIAGAIEDSGFDDAQKDRLRAALDAAGVTYTLETYPARHGWVPSDTPVHDHAQAERHFDNLFALLSRSFA